MGNPHKGFVVEGERGFWVVERQKQKASDAGTAEIVGCVGAIHRSWTDLKKVACTYDVSTGKGGRGGPKKKQMKLGRLR